MSVSTLRLIAAAFLALVSGRVAIAEDSLPHAEAFIMEEAREIALARSAAPAKISDDATVMVLRASGYETVVEGTNDYVCLVLRSWGNPSHDPQYIHMPGIIVPECLDHLAVATILPMQLLRAELGVAGTPGEEIKEAVLDGFRSGRLRRTERVSFSYMLSADMTLSDGSPLVPHVMVYLPDDYTNEMLGGLRYGDRVAFVEGGPDEPFTAANIYQVNGGIEPVIRD